MKINNIGYLCKEGIRGIFLHGFMSFAAVCVTVACLLIVGTFSALSYNLSAMITNLNKTNEVTAYVDEDLPDAEARSIGTKINRVSNVEFAEFISREEALDNFIADHPETDAFDGTSSDTLRHRFRIVLTDPRLLEQTKADLEAVPGVEQVNATEEIAAGFIMLDEVVKGFSLIMIGVLLVISLLIISNTVKLAVYDRRNEIAIMKMVGATNGFIRLPFIVQGFVLGMIGAGIAFALEWVAYDALANQIALRDSFGFFTIVPFQELLGFMIVIFAGAGMFVGIVGSWTSIRKFMDV